MIHHTNTRILEKIKKIKNPFFAKKPTKKQKVLILIHSTLRTLYSTYFHSIPPFAHHFLPVPPAPLGRPCPP